MDDPTVSRCRGMIERGEGHAVSVLTVTYPGGSTQQIPVGRERVAEVRQWLTKTEGADRGDM